MTDIDFSDAGTEAELFKGFLEESDEMLEIIENHSREMENDPDNLDHVHAIFRAAHSLKGNSSFFHFVNVQTFCHCFENYLDAIRGKLIEIDQGVIAIILEGADLLKNIFTRLHNTGGVDVVLMEDEAEFLKLVEERTGPTDDEDKLELLRKELLKFFYKVKQENELEEGSPVSEVFDIINKTAPFLVEDKRKDENEGKSKWMYDDLDVTRPYTGLRELVKDALEGQTDETAFAKFMGMVDTLIESHTQAEKMAPVKDLNDLKEDFEMFYQDEIGIDEMLAATIDTMLDEYAQNLIEMIPEKPKAPAVKAQAATAEGGQPDDGPAVRKANIVRVDESLLDVFIDHVGELITLSELFNYIQRKLEDNDLKGLVLNFKNTNQSFRELSHQLQRSLYEIRKAPMEGALGKLPRLARQIAKDTGKNIRLTTSGGETEVDKSLLEKLETIMVHLVRNSADHGIESPEARKEAEKDPEGKISIDVSSDRLSLFINVTDDGRGINVKRVRQVAVERGFLSEDAAGKLSDREAINYILKPGFSTAEKVTETSGRGVGMDVLAASLHDMGGSVSLNNSPGRGLEIFISTPLAYTTRIKLGLTLAIGDSLFLVPAENVRESFRARMEDVSSVEGRGEVVQRWGKIYPVVRLHKVFDIEPEHENIWEAICVLAESKGSTVCMIVDEMIGQRQIVYKQLTVQTKEPSVFEGVSILDGTKMALILSVDGIISQFNL